MTIRKKWWITPEKRRELIVYFIFGVSTTLVNILIFQGMVMCGIDYKIANLFAVVLGKLYAYITNKKFVFCSKCESFSEALKEFLRFVYARGITGLIDYFGLIFMVEYINMNPILSKYGLQAIIIVLNYILSKVLVFKKKREGSKR